MNGRDVCLDGGKCCYFPVDSGDSQGSIVNIKRSYFVRRVPSLEINLVGGVLNKNSTFKEEVDDGNAGVLKLNGDSKDNRVGTGSSSDHDFSSSSRESGRYNEAEEATSI